MTVYVLYDYDNVKSLHKTREGARKALVQSLRDDYAKEELEEFAQQDGYKTAEDYLAAILENDMFDDAYNMEVVGLELKD